MAPSGLPDIGAPSRLNERSSRSQPALEGGEPVELSFPISNGDRTIGRPLSGEMSRGTAPRASPTGRSSDGWAGQSFGAFWSTGIELRLAGTANDYVGKGLGGGRLVVAPRLAGRTELRHSPCRR